MAVPRFQPWQWVVIALLACLAALVPRPFADAVEGWNRFAVPVPAARAGATPALAGLPSPEPLVFEPLGRDRARMLNAQIAMTATPGAAARPFFLGGDAPSRERAVDCLASAMWYEAGDDAGGQRAVGQVVLNRVRHPSFPASVCGVVFQGSERRTGCQFTFTCDGALARRPSMRAFAAAQVEARALLDGVVDRDVGLATHYHTDWVHPVWSAQLAKIARVDTHLFFRWAGRWGDARAMTQRYAGREPAIPALAAISPIHRMAAASGALPAIDAPLIDAGTPALQPAALVVPPPPQQPRATPGAFELPVQIGGNGGAQAMAALGLCGDRDFCKVVGRAPDGAAVFLFVRDRRTGVERVAWDCDKFSRANPAQCLSPANRSWIAFDGNLQSGGKAPVAR